MHRNFGGSHVVVRQHARSISPRSYPRHPLPTLPVNFCDGPGLHTLLDKNVSRDRAVARLAVAAVGEWDRLSIVRLTRMRLMCIGSVHAATGKTRR